MPCGISRVSQVQFQVNKGLKLICKEYAETDFNIFTIGAEWISSKNPVIRILPVKLGEL